MGYGSNEFNVQSPTLRISRGAPVAVSPSGFTTAARVSALQTRTPIGRKTK
jgi:hypothetical protein